MYYSDLLLRKSPDGKIKFGIRAVIDDCYQHPNTDIAGKNAKNNVSLLPDRFFPDYELFALSHKAGWLYPSFPFSSMAFIDVLFVLQPKCPQQVSQFQGCKLLDLFYDVELFQKP